jgi:hypothetical protein
LGETRGVPEFCTCGAELPPDARFCHKCGKPQREEPNLAPEPPAPAWQQPPAEGVAVRPAPPEIGFRNSLAVRIGFLTGCLAFLASSLPFHPIIRLLFLLGAGAFAVYLYRRRSGFPVEVRGGVKMGWITGLFCFVIFTVLFTASFAALAFIVRDGSMISYIREQLNTMGMSQDKIQQAMEIFQNPVQIVGMLLWLFLTSTFVPALGGALGAKLLSRN